MTKSLPHRPRRRPTRRAAGTCPDDDAYVYTVAFEDDGRLSVWAYTTIEAATRTFHKLQRKALRGDADAQILISFTHLDCDDPHAHIADDT